MPALTLEQEALKQAAILAGSESWTSSGATVYGADGDSVCICHGNIGNMPEPLDEDDRAAFIALADPAAILAILAQLEAPQAVPDILFDGMAVYEEVQRKAGHMRTSPENVSDVLDAAVRLIRAAKAASGELGQ